MSEGKRSKVQVTKTVLVGQLAESVGRTVCQSWACDFFRTITCLRLRLFPTFPNPISGFQSFMWMQPVRCGDAGSQSFTISYTVYRINYLIHRPPVPSMVSLPVDRTERFVWAELDRAKRSLQVDFGTTGCSLAHVLSRSAIW